MAIQVKLSAVIIFYSTAISCAQSAVHILSGETRFVLNKTATTFYLIIMVLFLALNWKRAVEGKLMKQCRVWIVITLGIPQIQSCIKSINDGGVFALDHIHFVR